MKLMDEPTLLQRIEELERDKRILKQKLVCSERNRVQLEETLDTHSNALKTRNQELEESKEKLRASEARYREMAMHDKLTGLPNRSYFNMKLEKTLSRAERTKTSAALLFMDLNLFKTVNDCCGHKAGDSVLVQTARRILLCTRHGDIAARLGGDEFAILLPDIMTPFDAENVAIRVIEAISQPFHFDNNSGNIGVSIGISIYPDDALDSDKLLQLADFAMYNVKKTGENNYRFYHNLHAAAK